MESNKEQPRKDNHRNTGLKKCFSALVDRKQVNFDPDALILMLKHELSINFESLDPNLSTVLPFMLVVYIKNWPGWQRSKEYYSGKLNFKEWYEKFRQYIVVKLNYLIKNGYNLAIEMMKEEDKKERAKINTKTTERGSQTDYLAPRGSAPFTLTLDCPPKLLSSLVFSDSGDDVIMRQHPEISWTKLSIKDLLHWPHVSMEFVSPELAFKRKNCGEYFRFIHFNSRPINMGKVQFIEQVDIMDPSNGRNCFTLNMLRSYVEEYITVIRSAKELPELKSNCIEEAMLEFLTDVEEIDMNNTMASNTSVVFNIGNCSFGRNKKITKNNTGNNYFATGSQTEIGYSEIYIPKMETSLSYFKGVQDMRTAHVSFSYLNIVKNRLVKENSLNCLGAALPLITFKCEFCDIIFEQTEEILNHLEHEHKMEPNFLCCKCTKSFSINNLTTKRWKHLCENNRSR